MLGLEVGVVIGFVSLPGVDFHIQNFSLIRTEWLEEMADA
jgi:hypothetical protein